jgi:hypothetical protein
MDGGREGRVILCLRDDGHRTQPKHKDNIKKEHEDTGVCSAQTDTATAHRHNRM